MRAGASTERLRAPLAELTADAPAGSASGDDVHDDAPSTSGRPEVEKSFPGGGLRGILRASRDPSSGPRLRRLLLFTSLREFKPSEPFLVELYESRGLGAGTLTNDVFPAWTHARLPALVLVCAVAARFGCRRAVILGTACGMVTVGMTATFALFARAMNADAPTVLGVPALKWARASQVFAAVAFASHQAFLGIAFSDPSRFHASFDEASADEAARRGFRGGTREQRERRLVYDVSVHGEAVTRTFPAVAHGVKAATLLATCVSALLGQALARFGAPLASLLALTFATQTGSLLVARAFEKDISISGEETLPRTLATTVAADEGNEGGRRGSASGSEASVVGSSRFGKRTPRSFGARAFFRASYLASRAIVADPSVAAWCLWSVASAPTHAFVAANWQTLVTETPGPDGTRGDETGAKTFAFGAWLAAQRAAACLATLAFGAVAYGALIRSGPGRAAARRDDDDDDDDDEDHDAEYPARVSSSRRSGFVNPERSLFAASASLGASACFLLGASLAATRTSAALFVAAFVCVFEATSSVCAAAVGLEAGRAVLRAAPERLRLPRATSLAFVFAALSACGYAVDVSTQGVTDLLSLDVRRRFEARAAFAAFASGAFLVFLSARFARRAKTRSFSVTGETESAAATRAPLGASDADDPSARLLVAEDEA
jgi:hypothetical protein